jgi:hypothetical protein
VTGRNGWLGSELRSKADTNGEEARLGRDGEACGAAQLQPPFFAHQRGPRIYEPSCPSSSSSRTTAAGERPAPRVCVVGSRKSANIHVSSEIIWGIPAQFSFFPLPFLLRENRILYKPG